MAGLHQVGMRLLLCKGGCGCDCGSPHSMGLEGRIKKR